MQESAICKIRLQYNRQVGSLSSVYALKIRFKCNKSYQELLFKQRSTSLPSCLQLIIMTMITFYTSVASYLLFYIETKYMSKYYSPFPFLFYAKLFRLAQLHTHMDMAFLHHLLEQVFEYVLLLGQLHISHQCVESTAQF